MSVVVSIQLFSLQSVRVGRMSSVEGPHLVLSKLQSGLWHGQPELMGQYGYLYTEWERKPQAGASPVYQLAFINWKLPSNAFKISQDQYDTVTGMSLLQLPPLPPASLTLDGCVFLQKLTNQI